MTHSYLETSHLVPSLLPRARQPPWLRVRPGVAGDAAGPAPEGAVRGVPRRHAPGGPRSTPLWGPVLNGEPPAHHLQLHICRVPIHGDYLDVASREFGGEYLNISKFDYLLIDGCMYISLDKYCISSLWYCSTIISISNALPPLSIYYNEYK